MITETLEYLWLATVLFIPILFVPLDSNLWPFQVPKIVVLRVLVGLMGILIFVELLVVRRWRFEPDVTRLIPGFLEWLSQKPGRAVLIATVTFVGLTVLSALTSYSVRTSFWGKLPAGEGYGVYNSVAYLVLLLVIATHVNKRAQVVRLVNVLCITGFIIGLYAVVQWLELDPFGAVRAGDVRVMSTAGNPIFSGSVLVMTIPLTIALGLSSMRRGGFSTKTFLWFSVVLVQMLGIGFTLSRGPWLGLIAALSSFSTILFFVYLRSVISKKLIVSLGLSLGVVIFISYLFFQAFDLNDSVAVKNISERGVTVSRAFDTESGSTRLHLWQASWKLFSERPSFPEIYRDQTVIRHLLGYGPDTFQYVWVLGVDEGMGTELKNFFHYAHNYPAQVAVEIGMLGLLAYFAILFAIVRVGVTFFRSERNKYGDVQKLLMMGLTSALIGHFVEGLLGAPQSSDTVVLVALLALLIVVPSIDLGTPTIQSGQSKSQKTSGVLRAASQPTAWWRYLLVVCAALSILSLIWVKDIRPFRASFLGADSVQSLQKGDIPRSLSDIDRAIQLAPDVPDYLLQEAIVLTLASKHVDGIEQKRRFAEKAHATTKKLIAMYPLSARAVLAAANAQMDLVMLGREDLRLDGLELYKRLTYLRPDSYEAFDTLAAGYLLAGEPSKAKLATETSLAFSVDDEQKSRAYLLRGIAMVELKEFKEAELVIKQSVELGGLKSDELEEAKRLQSLIENASGRSD